MNYVKSKETTNQFHETMKNYSSAQVQSPKTFLIGLQDKPSRSKASTDKENGQFMIKQQEPIQKRLPKAQEPELKLPQPVNIPKSYLDSVPKTIGLRVQSEKSLLKPQNQQQATVKGILIVGEEQINRFGEGTYLIDIIGLSGLFQYLMQAVKYSLNQTTEKIKQPMKIYFPKKDERKTIIFDLDETLIHCNLDSTKPTDIVLNVDFPSGERMEAQINIRPYAQYILQTLAKHFELIIFTASHSSYANTIIDYLDPQKTLFSYRLYREHCISLGDGSFIKDLKILANRNLNNMLIVDNSAYSFVYQLENGVPILPYYDNKCDEELRHLLSYLMQFKNVNDVRQLNTKILKLSSYGSYPDAVDLLRTEFTEQID